MIRDAHYFFEDRPPTPKFIPLPPGKEVATQIEDGELFDYDLEVEPILEVLVGRSLLSATYELIQEEERKEYLSHKKKYEQEREFELINLQRMDAARQRREDEKNRRAKQVEQKKLYDIEIQKKLMSKMSSKFYLSNLKKNVVNSLFERGVLRDKQEMRLGNLISYEYITEADHLERRSTSIREALLKIGEDKLNELSMRHKSVVDKERERLKKIEEDKELARIVKKRIEFIKF